MAKGNVALSLALTSCSTLLAVIATPLLTWLYLGKSVDVPVASMMITMLKVSILPVALGVIINHFLSTKLDAVIKIFPSISILNICLITAIIIASNQNKLQNIALIIIAAVILHNLVGLVFGYIFSRLLSYNHIISKTLAIEVGMQNSGLGSKLAADHFSTLAMTPCAISALYHCLIGSLLAAYWRLRPPSE